MKAGASDFEAMFKKHVHKNLVLHGQMRGMDSMKMKKLQELERDRELFQKKYCRFPNKNLKRRASFSSTPRYKSTMSEGTPKPAFVVCKDFPYSFESWNKITDVSSSGLDIYKSNVLETDEAPVSFADEYVRVRTNSCMESKKSQTSTPRRVESVDIVEISGIRRRSNTMPEFEPQSFRPRSLTVAGCNRATHKIYSMKEDKTSSAQGTPRSSPTQLPDITAKSSSVANYSDNKCTEKKRVRKSSPKNSLLSVNRSPVSARRGSRALSQNDSIEKENSSPELVRSNTAEELTSSQIGSTNGMCRRSSSVQDNDNIGSMAIQRSHTMDCTTRPPRVTVTNISENPKLLERRDSRKYTIGIEGYSGFRKASIFEKLLSASCSALDDISGDQQNHPRQCRYIRVPGENVDGSAEDLSLDNLDFRHSSPLMEETNSIASESQQTPQ